MKRIFWLLVVINLVLLAYFNAAILLPSKPAIKLTEITPEKIKILTQPEIDALPLKTTPLNFETHGENCYEWGTFSDTNLNNAQSMLANLNIQATAKTINSKQSIRFWVYRAPLKNTAEAQKKAAEYKSLGVRDLFVVQEEKWKNAISFGVFEDEQLATKLMQELRTKGIKNIEKSLRSNDQEQHILVLSTLSENQISEINQLKPNFPTAELKQTRCN
jgi:hypothetical protein